MLDPRRRSHGGPRGTFTEQEGEVRNSERGKKKVARNSGGDERGGARRDGGPGDGKERGGERRNGDR